MPASGSKLSCRSQTKTGRFLGLLLIRLGVLPAHLKRRQLLRLRIPQRALDLPVTGGSIYCIRLYALAYTSIPTNCSKYDMALGRKHLGRTKQTTNLWQRMLHALLIFGLVLGTGVISDGVVAQGHHWAAPMGQHDGPMPDDNPVNGHSLVNCCTFSCSPSFAGDPENTGSEIRLPVRLAAPIIQDTPPRSIYLENEPPVPRPSFSQI
jgi:hypothetical protein